MSSDPPDSGVTPSWGDLLGMMGLGPHAARARGHYRYRRRDSSPPVSVDVDFVHRHPDGWRLTYAGGTTYVRDGRAAAYRDAQGRTLPPHDAPRLAGDESDPTFLLRRWDPRLWSDPADYHAPAAPPVAVRHGGRPAWQVTLEPPPHKTGELTLVVDAATGICLAMRHSGGAVEAELLDVEFGVEFPPEMFDPQL
jgi:hypothetical protein